MGTKSKATTETSQARANEQLQQIAAVSSAAVEPFMRACQAYTNGMATVNAELMGFINTRLTRDVELNQALCRCSNWSDAVDLQREWTRQATQEYLDEASRLMKVGSKLTQETWEPVYKQANQTLAELNKSVSQQRSP